MLSLVCVCYLSQHTVRREICSIRPRFPQGVCRYLNTNGYEHITSCLFLLLYINIPLEGRSIEVILSKG